MQQTEAVEGLLQQTEAVEALLQQTGSRGVTAADRGQGFHIHSHS